MQLLVRVHTYVCVCAHARSTCVLLHDALSVCCSRRARVGAGGDKKRGLAQKKGWWGHTKRYTIVCAVR